MRHDILSMRRWYSTLMPAEALHISVLPLGRRSCSGITNWHDVAALQEAQTALHDAAWPAAALDRDMAALQQDIDNETRQQVPVLGVTGPFLLQAFLQGPSSGSTPL